MQKIPVGYQALIERFALKAIPHYRSSYIKMRGKPTSTLYNHNEIHEYSKNYIPKDPNDACAQLEFALKHDGLNLEILALFFDAFDDKTLCNWIKLRPTSKYTRIAWFLFEMLTNRKLPIPDCKKTKYIDLLDPSKYFTAKPIKSTRHGINNNLLGDKEFCPMVRRTEKLNQYINKNLNIKAEEIMKMYEPNIITRASNYLLTKETMSSYAIEHEKPNQQRAAKFINLLQKIQNIGHLTKAILIECQNTIVDPRFLDVDYRSNQNYVGENINQYLQKVHFISPKPNNLPTLMEGLLKTLETMTASGCHPVITSSVIAFAFVFLHPFEDGNGRLHRFLIHYILTKQKFTPPGTIFPISAIMLQNIKDYDAILESFSKPLMENITDYHLDNNGELTVNQETKRYYQYIDFTKTSEYLFSCIEETVETHLSKELEFLVNYDKSKHNIQSVVDMPDKLIDLFIRCIMQNNGKLSKQKHEKYFQLLSQQELTELTNIVVTNMLK